MSELRKTILIVDDDVGDTLLLRNILKPEYLVIEAHEVKQAMETIRAEHLDLVITDVMMQKESGYSLCVHLKSNPNTKDIPVVMVTGLSTEINKKIGKCMGADAYLVKPVMPQDLRNAISRLLMPKPQTTKC